MNQGLCMCQKELYHLDASSAQLVLSAYAVYHIPNCNIAVKRKALVWPAVAIGSAVVCRSVRGLVG